MKTHYELVLKPAFMIPIESHESNPQQYLEGYGLGIDQGKITALIPPHALPLATADEIVELPEHAIMPGFVNSHAHSAMVLLRGLGNDAPILTWLMQYILPLEKEFVSAEFVYDGTMLAIAEMIQSGTTCFNDHYFFPEAAARAAQSAHIRANIGYWVGDVATNWAKGPDEYIAHFLNAMQHEPPSLISYALAPHGPYLVSDPTFKKIVPLAKQYTMAMHLHLHESKEEVQNSMKEFGKRPIKRLDELGVLTPHTQAVHVTQLDEEDWDILRRTKPHIISCPESNLKLASGFTPVQQFLDEGFNVALGTDGACSNNDLDMLSEMRTLALLGKGVSGNADSVSAHTALTIATLNGAKALGLDHKIGSLVPGKEADIIAIDLSDVSTQPLYDPITHIVYAAGRHQITDVWVQGKPLMRNRTLLTCDLAAIKAHAKQWKNKVTQFLL